MKTSQLFLVLLALGFTACTAKVDAIAPGIVIPPGTSGVDLTAYNGTWKTGCVAQNSFFYSSTTLVLLNGSYKLQTAVYDNNDCSNVVSQQPDDAGTFTISSGDPSAILEIDMFAPREGGATQIYRDLIKIEGNSFFLGDETTMNAEGRPTKIDYTKPYLRQ